MTLKPVSRRQFLAIGGSLAVATVVGVRPRALRAASSSRPPRVIYRLSLRGRRGSKAAKLHNANLRFATATAADLHRAHPGDNSRIVQLTVSDSVFQRLFPTAESTVADLRHITLGCIGDCGRDGAVTVDEILAMVNDALGNSEAPPCKRGDLNRDAAITVDEILTAVSNALQGCS